ncbi:MAG: HlyD family type I secretion periplasmic adaptor subunit [Alphaproteobacteria bacterium]|nr:HlyD family type I secretion periplasmic adaptor subunit [Alphaproteobacteria bacterium]
MEKAQKQELEYMDELQAALRMRPATPVYVLLFIIMAFVLFVIIWAAVTKIDIISRAQGQVVPSQEIQIVQSLEGGILEELLIAKGDLVEKGQVLLRISDVAFSSEERGTEARFRSLEAKKARLEAESLSHKFTLPQKLEKQIPEIAANERALYKSRQKELRAAYDMQDENINKAKAELAEVGAEINRLYKNRSLLNKELTIIKEMVEKRAVPKLDQIRLEREQADISGQINARAQEKKGLEAELASTRSQRKAQTDKFRSIALEELNEVKTEIAALKENLKSMGDRVDRAELRAPVSGIVNQITLQTIGGVVEPAMKLVEIVPADDELKILAKVKPEEMAFLEAGQPVRVKITAYDPQRYGSLEGVLTRVAANSVSDREGNIMFEIEALTNKNYLGTLDKPLPITAGMVANVDIITGKRTILTYLTKPFHRGLSHVFRER